MSSTPSQETVEQTKQQIRGLINEIAELSRTDHPADEYYPAVLQRIIDALAAVGGAIWLIDEAGALRLSYQIKVNQNLLQADSEDAMCHGRLLSRMFARNQSDLVPPALTSVKIVPKAILHRSYWSCRRCLLASVRWA